MNTYHVIGIYHDSGEQYIDEVEARSPRAAWHQAQANAIVNNARPVPDPKKILWLGKELEWDFTEPELQKYSEFQLDHAATYQVVEPGTLDSETLKLVE